MNHSIFMYILVSFLTSYCIRVLPLTLIRKPITNRFLKSFLYYVPYVTLAVMTFPTMVQATNSQIAGIASLCVGIVLAYFDPRLPVVACACCMTVFLLEFFFI